jgi:hypothetical protein
VQNLGHIILALQIDWSVVQNLLPPILPFALNLGLKQRYPHRYQLDVQRGNRVAVGSLTLWPIIADDWDELIALIVL